MRLRNAGRKHSARFDFRSPRNEPSTGADCESSAKPCAAHVPPHAWNETAEESHLPDPTDRKEQRSVDPLLAPGRRWRERKNAPPGIPAPSWREWDRLRWSDRVTQPPGTRLSV